MAAARRGVVFAVLALGASTAAAAPPPPLCLGSLRLDLPAAVVATVADGPDFTVTRFADPVGAISVYQGCCADIDHPAGRAAFDGKGFVVTRAMSHGRFGGYLVVQNAGQMHFFGPGLKGDTGDAAFFARLHKPIAGTVGCRATRHE